MVICSKVGGARKPDKSWITFNTPENLRTSIDNNLRTLKIEQMSLLHFRVMPGMGTFEESMDAMFAMQKEGKILHVGVSNVSTEELATAMSMGEIATVENMYGHAQRTTSQTHVGLNRGGEEVLSMCEENEIPSFHIFPSLIQCLKKMTASLRLQKNTTLPTHR